MDRSLTKVVLRMVNYLDQKHYGLRIDRKERRAFEMQMVNKMDYIPTTCYRNGQKMHEKTLEDGKSSSYEQ